MCVVVVFVFVPLLQTRTHAHTRTTNIRTLTHSNTHHMSSVFFCFFFFFLVEKDMAQWRDTPPLGRTHRSPGGDGGRRDRCHGYQGSSSSPALWVSKRGKKKEMERGGLAFSFVVCARITEVKILLLMPFNNVSSFTFEPSLPSIIYSS